MPATVTTVICCTGCDAPVIRIPDAFEYLDPKGEIAALCGDCAR